MLIGFLERCAKGKTRTPSSKDDMVPAAPHLAHKDLKEMRADLTAASPKL